MYLPVLLVNRLVVGLALNSDPIFVLDPLPWDKGVLLPNSAEFGNHRRILL